MASVEDEFRPKNIGHGGILMLRPTDALSMILRCRDLQILVLGIDAFILTEHTTQPVMEHSVDLSDYAQGDSWTLAEKFLRKRMDKGFVFEIVVPAQYQ